jgi:hypothetical protein
MLYQARVNFNREAEGCVAAPTSSAGSLTVSLTHLVLRLTSEATVGSTATDMAACELPCTAGIGSGLSLAV